MPRNKEYVDPKRTLLRMERDLMDRATAKAKSLGLNLNAAINKLVAKWVKK